MGSHTSATRPKAASARAEESAALMKLKVMGNEPQRTNESLFVLGWIACFKR